MKSSVNYCWECGSKAEEKFVEGRRRKVCTGCGRILYQNPFPTTAAIIVNPDDEILLVQRAVRPAVGKWCLPGGFLELGETPQQGVLRELKEETNLDGNVLNLVGISPSLYGVWGDVVVMGFHVTVNGGQVIPGDDARDVRYFPMKDLPSLAFSTHQHLVEVFQEKDYPGEQKSTE